MEEFGKSEVCAPDKSPERLEWETPDFEIMDINDTKAGVGVGTDGGGGDDGTGS